MKKIILAGGLITGLAFMGIAQPVASPATLQKQPVVNKSPEEKAKKDAERAEKDLGLTADQKNKWEAAALKRITANTPYREKMKGSTTPDERRDLHKQMLVNAKTFDADVNAFLTEDQKKKKQELRAKRKEGQRQGMKGQPDDLMED